LIELVHLQGTIGSTFFQQVNSIIQSPERLPTILGAALPDSSNFFMQFIAMRALFLIWLRLCVPHGGVWQNWMHYCCCPRFCCSTCNTGEWAMCCPPGNFPKQAATVKVTCTC
jgi:hypothetical protein